jgi:hypothetical protein
MGALVDGVDFGFFVEEADGDSLGILGGEIADLA